MIQNPTAVELVEAVSRFLSERAAPALKDRDAFLCRVAVNALGVVVRELKAGAVLEADTARVVHGLLGVHDASEQHLCQAIRQGEFDGREQAVVKALEGLVAAQVEIDQPNYAGLAAAKAALAREIPAAPPGLVHP